MEQSNKERLIRGQRLLTNVIAGVTVPGDLDSNGFDAVLHIARDDNFREDWINAARQVIRSNLRKMRAVGYGVRSEWVQTHVEERLGIFLSRGELIVAMIGESF